MLPELERLERYRLDRDLTWAELATAMREAGFPVGAATLHQLVTHPTSVPFDRTLHKIRQFLAPVDRAAARAAAKRAKPRRRPRV